MTVLGLLHATATSRPDATALVDAKTSLTFSELTAWGAAIAAKLAPLTGAQSQPLPVFAPKSAGAIAAFVGALMSGNAYCPIDVKSPPGRLRSVLDVLGAEAALTTSRLAPKLVEAGFPAERLVLIDTMQADAAVDWAAIQARVAHVTDHDPVYVIFTSGSTGVPKGVTIPHRGVNDYIRWAIDCYGVDHTDVIGNQAPLFFDNSTLDVYLCFATGAALHLIPESLYMFPVRLLEYLQEHRVTTVFWVPSVLVTIANLGLLGKRKLPSLRRVLFAGEVMPATQLKEWLRLHPDAVYSNLYGPTEITVDCTYYMVPPDFDGDDVPIGVPCHNTGILLLGKDGKEVGTDEPGELCVRGAGLALGYWNNRAQTDRAFQQNPLHDRFNDPIYRTGDLARRGADGLIRFIGRKDNQIKHRGYRIELGEIESAASGLPGVAQCCCVYDAQRKDLHLFAVPDGEVDVKHLRRLLGQALPKYMVPGRVHLQTPLPMTRNGKIDRRALHAQAMEQTNP